MIVSLVVAMWIGLVVGFLFYQYLSDKYPKKVVEHVTSEMDLPSILKDLIKDYLDAKANSKSFGFMWSIEKDGVTVSIARCPACGQKNKLRNNTIDGAKCASCGVPLERYPKAKESTSRKPTN